LAETSTGLAHEPPARRLNVAVPLGPVSLFTLHPPLIVYPSVGWGGQKWIVAHGQNWRLTNTPTSGELLTSRTTTE
jgi:hypothetical protein